MTPNVEAPHVSKSRKEIAKETLHKLMREESKMVKGRFINYETPGASATIEVLKYPTPKDGGIPPFKKSMKDGEVYEIPLYVARFLNGIDKTAGAATNDIKVDQEIGTCSYVVHGFKYTSQNMPMSQEGTGPTGEGGIPVPMIGIAKRVRRYGFQPLDFSIE